MDYRGTGQNIQSCRVKRGMTQEQLAERADLSVSHIRQIELGLKGVSLAALYRIAESLDTSAQALLASKETGEIVRLQALLTGCTAWERDVIADVIEAVLEGLRKHRES